MCALPPVFSAANPKAICKFSFMFVEWPWSSQFLYFCNRVQETFSVKGQRMLGFVGYMLCVTITQLCHFGLKAATDNGKSVGVAELQSSFIYKNRWPLDLALWL